MQSQKLEWSKNAAKETPAGRDMDFSFKQKIQPHKFAKKNNDIPKIQRISEDKSANRQFEVTLSAVPNQNPHLYSIKRLEQKMDETQQVLERICEISNQNGEANLFSNIKCSTQSQHSSQKSNQQRFKRIITQKKIQDKRLPKSKAQPDKTIYRVSTIIKKQGTQYYEELDLTIPNVYQSQVLFSATYGKYKKQVMNIFRLSNIRISEKKLSIEGVKKIKIFPYIIKDKSFQIQLTHKNGKFVFGAELKRQLYFLPEHYIWFAKIINAKLMTMGFQMKNSAQILNNNQNMGWSGPFCQGQIFKKSKYLKNWQRRHVVINTEGLFSYQSRDQNYTVFVPMQSVKQLSTEMDIYQKNLIIRLSMEELKIDFAIPIHDYCLKIQNNWLFAFYRLLMEHKHHIKIA